MESLWEEVRALSLGDSSAVERLQSSPTSLQFLRDFVSRSKPCIIAGETLRWPAISRWKSDSYLVHALSHSPPVSVHLTPDGKADAVARLNSGDLCFASAAVRRVPFAAALDLVGSSSAGNGEFVAYAQQQNDCFRSEYVALAGDCDAHVAWASEAFGCLPEAVNLWIGGERSETSFHKDHYENLFAVVTGQKRFLLLPPTDVHRMYVRDYPAAQYSYSEETKDFTLELEEPLRYVPWCSVNPYPSPESRDAEMDQFPLYFEGPKPFECTVNPGEILYLPSMWFHHVTQSRRTIAVNYWYDMQYDIKYAYFNFLQSLPHPLIQNVNLEHKGREPDADNSSTRENSLFR